MPTKIINLRLDEELLRQYDEIIVPEEKLRSGFSVSRNEVFVKALEWYAKKPKVDDGK